MNKIIFMRKKIPLKSKRREKANAQQVWWTKIWTQKFHERGEKPQFPEEKNHCKIQTKRKIQLATSFMNKNQDTKVPLTRKISIQWVSWAKSVSQGEKSEYWCHKEINQHAAISINNNQDAVSSINTKVASSKFHEQNQFQKEQINVEVSRRKNQYALTSSNKIQHAKVSMNKISFTRRKSICKFHEEKNHPELNFTNKDQHAKGSLNNISTKRRKINL